MEWAIKGTENLEKNKKILIIDDEYYIVHSLTFLFKEEGYTCFAASNAEEAMKLIRSESVGIVFLDLILPGKIGYEICRSIKSDPDLKDIYIFNLTAQGQESDRKKGMESGADKFLLKPFDPREIVELVKKI